jgi:hypothetical protein
MKITYLTKKERKTIRRGDFGSKLALNHPFSIDKKNKGGDGWGLGEKRDD